VLAPGQFPDLTRLTLTISSKQVRCNPGLPWRPRSPAEVFYHELLSFLFFLRRAPNVTHFSLSIDKYDYGFHSLTFGTLTVSHREKNDFPLLLPKLLELRLVGHALEQSSVLEFVEERKSTLHRVYLQHIRDGRKSLPGIEDKLRQLLSEHPDTKVELDDCWNGGDWVPEWVRWKGWPVYP
jgi:hypothetical protein